jgi:hypothetical protein
MNDHSQKPEWYDVLVQTPLDHKPFTQEMMRKVEAKAETAARKPSFRRRYLSGLVTAAVLGLLMSVWWLNLQEGNTVLPPSGEQTPAAAVSFDPKQVKVGDRVGEWQVSRMDYETYGVGSIQTSFTGNVELSGTFEYTDQRHDYNPNQIVLRLDESSRSKLPRMLGESSRSIERVVVLILGGSDQGLAGSSGRTGQMKLRTSSLTTVSAPILEGTPDVVTTTSLLEVKMDPIKPILEWNEGLAAALKPFPKLPNGDSFHAGDAELVYPWLQQISTHYAAITHALSEQVMQRTVSSDVKEQAGQWLSMVFTSELARKQLEELFMPAPGGFYVSSGILHLLPPVPIEKVENPVMRVESKTRYVYTVKLIATGTNDYMLSCVLVHENDGWKLESLTTEPM